MAPQLRPGPVAREPIDSDIDLREAPRRGHRLDDASVLAVIAAGGALGAAARYVISRTWPAPPSGFPWATLVINVIGCALIGILMVLVSDLWTGQRLLRPFVGTGVLGGFTTFSTYAVDTAGLITTGHAHTALLYLALTVVGALSAVWASAVATRRVLTWRLS